MIQTTVLGPPYYYLICHLNPSLLCFVSREKKKKERKKLFSLRSTCAARPSYFTNTHHCSPTVSEVPVFHLAKVSSVQLSEGFHFFISCLYPGSGFPSTFLCFLLSICEICVLTWIFREAQTIFLFILASHVFGTSELMKAFIRIPYLSIKTRFLLIRVVIHSTNIYWSPTICQALF